MSETNQQPTPSPVRVADLMASVWAIDTAQGKRRVIARGGAYYNIARAAFVSDRLAASQFAEPDDADAVVARINARDFGFSPTLADRLEAADAAIDDKATGRLAKDVRQSPFADKPLTPAEKDRINAYVESQRSLIEAMGRMLDCKC
jgi:hypothetical protein